MFDRDRIILQIYVFYVVTGAEVWYPYSGTLMDNDIVTNKFSNIVYIDQVYIDQCFIDILRIVHKLFSAFVLHFFPYICMNIYIPSYTDIIYIYTYIYIYIISLIQ